jgi:hypothetical protein
LATPDQRATCLFYPEKNGQKDKLTSCEISKNLHPKWGSNICCKKFARKKFDPESTAVLAVLPARNKLTPGQTNWDPWQAGREDWCGRCFDPGCGSAA